MTSHPESDPVYRITNAGVGLSEEQAGRQRRYLISMGVRTMCFIGAILASGPLRWVLFFLAVVLPYVAVVIANAGRERSKDSDLRIVLPPPPPQLGPTTPGRPPTQ